MYRKTFIYIAIFATAFSLGPTAALATTLFSDNFGSTDTSVVAGWTQSEFGVSVFGSESGEDETLDAIATNKFVKMGMHFVYDIDNNIVGEHNGWICKEIDASGFESMTLSYDWRGSSAADFGQLPNGTHIGDKGLVYYDLKTNCDEWSDSYSLSGGWNRGTLISSHFLGADGGIQNPWEFYETGISDLLNNSAFLLIFISDSSDSEEYFRVDDIEITGSVIDTTAPVVTLVGEAEVTLEAGTAYADAGATALDDVDGDITGDIVVVGVPTGNDIGDYTITYNVSDAAGNPATEVTRTVHVVAPAPTPDPTPTPAQAPAQSSTSSSGSSSGRGGGGGGGFSSVRVTTTTANTGGAVLGASTFKFTLTTRVGSTGNEVTELQKRLTSEGFYTGPITGYFGPLTKAAVEAYQTAKGLEAVGIVGPKTRAALNGAVPTMTVEEMKILLAQLQAQLVALMKQAGLN